MDGAGWHKSKELIAPEHIEIIYLPPYSPELNPLERLWLHIKSPVLRNKLYESLGELESALCQFVRSMKGDTVAQICRANDMIN
jgi:transposase